MIDEIHISSMIVHAIPPCIEDLVMSLTNAKNLEVVTADKVHGKIIIVAEESSMHKISQHMEKIKTLDGVLSISMVYHHVESTSSLREETA